MDSSLFQGNFARSERIVYTPSVFAKKNLIYLQEIGTLRCLNPYTSRRKNLDSYLFFLVLEGAGKVEYHNLGYKVCAGDCIFLDCHHPYAHRSSNDLWKLAWIHFTGPSMNAIYEKFLQQSGSPIFSPRDTSLYCTLHKEIYSIASCDDYIQDMHIMEKLTVLLSHLMEDSWNQEFSEKRLQTRYDLIYIKEYLDSNFHKKISLDDLSERFFINKYHLIRIFKEQYSLTVNQYLLQTRITHAKHLLRFTPLSIEEVGLRCGMDDPNYFSRIFRKIEGIPPRQFRKEWASKKE